MSDSTDLISRLNKMADLWDANADIYGARQPNYRVTAALLREAAKALKEGECWRR
jgi:hypothetical protein